jgi:hypothetical protein
MRGFWFVVSTAFRVIWQGTWQAHSLRLITGVNARSLCMTDVGFPPCLQRTSDSRSVLNSPVLRSIWFVLVCRAAGSRHPRPAAAGPSWRMNRAEREHNRALASARAEGVSIRALAAAAGALVFRVHQIVAAAGLDALDTIADRLVDEAGRLRQCSGWPAAGASLACDSIVIAPLPYSSLKFVTPN